ncbi:MAG: hypothetical protein H6753_01090 [Candidatus Omnitrophica bacterium]|nr:hypothetical protein [Candidatus Omnitrophota bacterium]
MKNKIIIAVAILMLFGFATTSFAGKPYKSAGVSYWTYEGVVIKLLPDQGALIVKDNDDGKEIHIHVDQDTQSKLQVGDQIKFNMQGAMCVIMDVIKK